LGFSDQYFMVSDGKGDFRAELSELPEEPAWYQANGWRAIVLSRPVELPQLERVAARLSSSSRLVAAVCVETNDYAYFVGASGGEVAFRAVLNDLIARDSREGSWALERCVAFADSPIWRFDATQRVVACRPRSRRVVEVEAVLTLLNKNWILATEAAAEFTRLIEVPDVADDWLP
jgi:hypothetical protein